MVILVHIITHTKTYNFVIVIFCNDKKLFHFSYQRYLENQLRSVFGLEGTPIVLTIRQKGEDDG